MYSSELCMAWLQMILQSLDPWPLPVTMSVQ